MMSIFGIDYKHKSIEGPLRRLVETTSNTTPHLQGARSTSRGAQSCQAHNQWSTTGEEGTDDTRKDLGTGEHEDG